MCVTICMPATNETKLPAVIKTTISRSMCNVYITLVLYSIGDFVFENNDGFL